MTSGFHRRHRGGALITWRYICDVKMQSRIEARTRAMAPDDMPAHGHLRQCPSGREVTERHLRDVGRPAAISGRGRPGLWPGARPIIFAAARLLPRRVKRCAEPPMARLPDGSREFDTPTGHESVSLRHFRARECERSRQAYTSR